MHYFTKFGGEQCIILHKTGRANALFYISGSDGGWPNGGRKRGICLNFGSSTGFGGGSGKDVGGEHGVARREMHPVQFDRSENAKTGG